MDKTWTATDIQLGKLTITRMGSAIQIGRRYQFLDSEGAVLGQIAGGRLVAEMKIAEIPPAILSALQTIDGWTKERALEQEGMS